MDDFVGFKIGRDYRIDSGHLTYEANKGFVLKMNAKSHPESYDVNWIIPPVFQRIHTLGNESEIRDK